MSQQDSNNPHPVVPPETVASPSQLAREGQQQWYLPGWGETLKLMRWRVLYFLPAAVLACMMLAALVLMPQLIWMLLGWWKIVFIAVALPLGVAVKTAKNAVRLRSEPFCIHCGYGLTGLPDGHICPECGCGFSYQVIEEYRRDPHWFIERHKAHRALPMADEPFLAGRRGSKRPRSRDGT